VKQTVAVTMVLSG